VAKNTGYEKIKFHLAIKMAMGVNLKTGSPRPLWGLAKTTGQASLRGHKVPEAIQKNPYFIHDEYVYIYIPFSQKSPVSKLAICHFLLISSRKCDINKYTIGDLLT
jgi:hypothetical protein